MNIADTLKNITSAASVIAVVVGVCVSVANYRAAKEKEAESRKYEATKPFLELRQKMCLDALENASILASGKLHNEEEVKNARKRFYELYWGVIALVEDTAVEKKMVAFVNAEQSTGVPLEIPTLNLAHAIRQSLIHSWKVDTVRIGATNP